jgi:hypothetical protein
VWLERVIEAPPAFDHDAGFSECIEDLAIEKLVSQFTSVEP